MSVSVIVYFRIFWRSSGGRRRRGESCVFLLVVVVVGAGAGVGSVGTQVICGMIAWTISLSGADDMRLRGRNRGSQV